MTVQLQNKQNNKNDSVRVKLTTGHKTEWTIFLKSSKFPSLSQLIRYSVDKYIEMKRKKGNNNKFTKISETQELIITKQTINSLESELKTAINKIDNLATQMNQEEEIVIEESLKGQVLKWLKKYKFTSEELAEIIQTSFPRTQMILNKLKDMNLVKHDSLLRYEVIEIENIN